MTKKTWDDFVSYSNKYLSQTDTKVCYAVEKVLRLNKNISSDFQESVADIQIEFCSVDDKGNIIFDEHGRRKFTRENEKNLNKAVKELYNEEIKIKPFYCTDKQWVDSLNEDEKEIFKGIILE